MSHLITCETLPDSDEAQNDALDNNLLQTCDL